MGDIYRQYCEAWAREGGDLFCYFASTGRWRKWGSWGILQHYDDDPAQSPKFMATLRWGRPWLCRSSPHGRIPRRRPASVMSFPIAGGAGRQVAT
jgi:hypothetical protein